MENRKAPQRKHFAVGWREEGALTNILEVSAVVKTFSICGNVIRLKLKHTLCVVEVLLSFSLAGRAVPN